MLHFWSLIQAPLLLSNTQTISSLGPPLLSIFKDHIYHSWFSRSSSTSITTKGSAESPICWTFCCSCKKVANLKLSVFSFVISRALLWALLRNPSTNHIHSEYLNSHFLFTAALIKTPFYDSHRDLSVKAGPSSQPFTLCKRCYLISESVCFDAMGTAKLLYSEVKRAKKLQSHFPMPIHPTRRTI